VATSLAQIFTNTYQKSLDCNALQLLYHTTPYITLVCLLLVLFVLSLPLLCYLPAQGMLIMCPFFDDLTALAAFEYKTPCVIRIGECRLPLSSLSLLNV
jgi:hypothetical protein